MSDAETVMSQLNYIAYLQNTINLECKTIMELQSKEQDLNTYTQYQTALNSLFVQHMELGLKATGLVTTENLKLSSAEDGVDSACRIRRTLSCESGVMMEGATLSGED
jgi:hypothetical protein